MKPHSLLYILTCSWSGAVTPTMRMLEDRFPAAGVIDRRLPRSRQYWNLIRTFHPDRMTWRRKKNFYNEHTPKAFRERTALCEKELARYAGRYDAIFQNGVLHAPGIRLDRGRYLIMTDSTRRLSLANPHDEQCHFSSDRQAEEWFALEGEVYRHAAAIIVGCRRVTQSLINDYGVLPDRIHNCGYVPGVGFEISEGEKTYDGRTILFVGKGDFEKKGGHVLLDAFESVRKQIGNAELYLVGQDGIRPREGVHILGFVRDRNRLRDLFTRAHLFVLPSLVDRNPLTLVEAMATATPCVTTDYGAMPEIVGETGFIVPAGDTDALADRMIRLLENPDLARRMGASARRRFLERYSPEIVKKKYRLVIESVMA